MDKTSALLQALSLEHHVSVMRESNISFLTDYLLKHPQLKTILEIGTGCGYSAYRFSQLPTINRILTLEKDVKRYTVAKTQLANFTKIQLIQTDAKIYTTDEKFGAIIFDGPKKPILELMEHFKNNYTKNAICIIDNFWMNDIRNLYKLTKQPRLKKIIIANENLQMKINDLKKQKQILIDPSGDGLIIIEMNAA